MHLSKKSSNRPHKQIERVPHCWDLVPQLWYQQEKHQTKFPPNLPHTVHATPKGVTYDVCDVNVDEREHMMDECVRVSDHTYLYTLIFQCNVATLHASFAGPTKSAAPQLDATEGGRCSPAKYRASFQAPLPAFGVFGPYSNWNNCCSKVPFQ